MSSPNEEKKQKSDETEQSKLSGETRVAIVEKDGIFTLELDQAFAEFNQIINGLYMKHDKTAADTWNATKRIMILRQKLEKRMESAELL